MSRRFAMTLASLAIVAGAMTGCGKPHKTVPPKPPIAVQVVPAPPSQAAPEPQPGAPAPASAVAPAPRAMVRAALAAAVGKPVQFRKIASDGDVVCGLYTTVPPERASSGPEVDRPFASAGGHVFLEFKPPANAASACLTRHFGMPAP